MRNRSNFTILQMPNGRPQIDSELKIIKQPIYLNGLKSLTTSYLEYKAKHSYHGEMKNQSFLVFGTMTNEIYRGCVIFSSTTRVLIIRKQRRTKQAKDTETVINISIVPESVLSTAVKIREYTFFLKEAEYSTRERNNINFDTGKCIFNEWSQKGHDVLYVTFFHRI